MEGFRGKRVGTCFAITEEDCRLIHETVVRVLEQGGMRCDDPRAAKLYEQAGCSVEDDGRLVKIPERVIDAAFKTCPGDFTVHGREPKNDVSIGTGEVHFATMTGRYIRDLRTGERRKVTRQDAIDGARMADALENVHGLYKSVMWVYDEPKVINSQILVGEMMKNTTKGMTWVYNTGAPNEIPDLIKLWQIAAGGEEELRRKPHVLGHVIANPPRVVDVNYTDWMIGFCDAGLPITVYSATMAGATGPATLAGMMVQVIAESVALVVLAQAYKPGHPLCFCSFNPSMDMRTGLWSFGNPEYSTLGTGIARMASFYGIPCVAFGNTDSCDTDQQTAYEKALVLFNYALAGISLTWSLGGTAGFNFVTWDQMVIDDEVAQFVGHYLKGIRVDPERLSEELILKVGPLPGSYMNEEHTRTWYREEFLMPKLSNREFFETWERGHTDLQEKAKQKARDILETHQSPVPQEAQDEIDDYLAYVRRRDVDKVTA